MYQIKMSSSCMLKFLRLHLCLLRVSYIDSVKTVAVSRQEEVRELLDITKH